MADHTDNDLRAAAKALRDVVAPALDPANPIAQQQLKMVIEWLDFHRERRPLHPDRERFELQVQLESARELASLAPDAAASLQPAIDAGTAVLDRLLPRPAVVREVTAALEDALSAAVQRAADLDAPTRRAVERAVLRHTKDFLDGQRAWFLPLSIEPDKAAVPPLAKALRLPDEPA